MRVIALLFLAAIIAASASADGLLDNLKKGVSSAGEAGRKGLEAVEGAYESTNELVRNEETPEQTRAKLDNMADEILIRLLSENENAADAYQASAGYAAFDMRRVSIFPLSAGYGRGVAVSSPDLQRTYMQMGTGGVGAAFGIGGFESQFVIMFKTPIDFERFVEHGYDASAEAGAMEGEASSSKEVKFTEGRTFFVLSKTGWRVNANASGTRYWKDADLN